MQFTNENYHVIVKRLVRKLTACQYTYTQSFNF